MLGRTLFLHSLRPPSHILTHLKKEKNNASSRHTNRKHKPKRKEQRLPKTKRKDKHEQKYTKHKSNNKLQITQRKERLNLRHKKRETPTSNEKKCQEQRQLILHSNQLDCSSQHFETSKILLSLVAGAAWPPLSLGAASLHPRAFGQCCFSIFFCGVLLWTGAAFTHHWVMPPSPFRFGWCCFLHHLPFWVVLPFIGEAAPPKGGTAATLCGRTTQSQGNRIPQCFTTSSEVHPPGDLGTLQFLSHRHSTSMTRAMVEDGVKPSVRCTLWFVGYLSVTCRDSASIRWHKGCQEEFKTRARGMRPMQAWSLVDPARPCGSSVDPIQSAVRKQSAKKGNINQGKGEAKQYHRKGEENGSATQRRRKRKATLPKEAAPPIRDEEVKAAPPQKRRERTHHHPEGKGEGNTTQEGKAAPLQGCMDKAEAPLPKRERPLYCAVLQMGLALPFWEFFLALFRTEFAQV